MNKGQLLRAIAGECEMYLLKAGHISRMDETERSIRSLNKLTQQYIDEQMQPPALGVKVAEIVTPRDRFGG